MSSYQGILGLLGTAKFSALAPIHLTRPEESWWNFIPPITKGKQRPLEGADLRVSIKILGLDVQLSRNPWSTRDGKVLCFGSHPSDKEGKLVKFRQLSNSRKWSTTDHQLLPAAKHHSSFFIIFSLEIKIKCLLSFANPSFQTPKVPTGISYVNLKEPSPVESARLQILTPKWMIIGKGKSKLLNNPSALPIARGFITRLLYSKTSANSSGLESTYQ